MDTYLIFVKKGSPEWDFMWAELGKHPKNNHLEKPTEALNNFETWQYMGSRWDLNQIRHEFRHRCHPEGDARLYLNIDATALYTANAKREMEKEKVNFRDILITLAFLRSSSLSGFFKDLKVCVDRDEQTINFYSNPDWIRNRVIRNRPGTQFKTYYAPEWEIGVTKVNGRLEYLPVIPCYKQDSDTGFWDELEFEVCHTIVDAISHFIKMQVSDYHEHLAENYQLRKIKKS